jgi:hypothetical protein
MGARDGSPMAGPMMRVRTMLSGFGSGPAKVRQHLLRAWRLSSTMPRAAFIVGCGRSGTSMLLERLSKSWQVDPYNEDHAAAFRNYRLRDLKAIAGLVREGSAPVALFKPILNSCQTGELLSTFRGSRAVFVCRHYEDVINSSLRKFGVMNRITHVRTWMEDDFAEFAFAPPPSSTREAIRALWNPSLEPESGAALYWLFYNLLYFDLGLAQDERVALAQYEWLVREAKVEFQRIATLLDIQFERSMVEGVFASSIQRHTAPPIEAGVRKACEDLWQKLCEQREAEYRSFLSDRSRPA